MNRKGFTLVELLAVITILALLGLIAGISVTKIIKDSREDMYNTQLLSIKEAARIWGSENVSLLPSPGECRYITLGYLKDTGIVDSDVIDSRDNTKINDNLKIKITNNINKYGKSVVEYEVNSTDTKSCSEWPYIKLATPTTGIQPTVDQNQNFLPGSEFSIKVNEDIGYLTFFVLSNDGEYVNLIAEQNITIDGNFTSELQDNDEWYKLQSDNRYGPQTAYNYLSNATSSWINIPIIESFNYLDEGNQENSSYGYQSVETKFDETSGDYITTITPLSSDYGNQITYKNMRTRLPYLSEIVKNTTCEVHSSLDSYGSCPIWMVNYLKSNDYYLVSKGKVNSTGDNYGYWLLFSSIGYNNSARYIDYNGTVSSVITNAVSRGIRPVITILKTDLLKVI